MNGDNVKILIKGDKIVTLKELFSEEAKARKEMAHMSFEKKIKALITLQELAYKWGKKRCNNLENLKVIKSKSGEH